MTPTLRLSVLGLLLLAAFLPAASAAEPVAAQPRIHNARGVVRSIAPDQRTTVIRHEAIPDFMPAMTMELTVRDPHELQGIQRGDTITFRLLSDDETHWIDTLRRVGTTNPPAAAAVAPEPAAPPRPLPSRLARELKVGDAMPDVALLAETGQALRFSDFRGRALAFTFIFTRCPLPDFCPLMGRNFARARELLRGDTHAPTNRTFLSISFDPEFDTPAVLTAYARGQRGDDGADWVFAAAPTPALRELAPRLDLMVNREGGSISHNLRTVVLDTRGRVHRQFDGNRWKAEELAHALREASAVPASP